MKNLAIAILLVLVVFLCAAKRQPALTINGQEVHELRFDAPMMAQCWGNGACTIKYYPLPDK